MYRSFDSTTQKEHRIAQINQFTVTIFWKVHPNLTVFSHLKQFDFQDFS